MESALGRIRAAATMAFAAARTSVQALAIIDALCTAIYGLL